MPHPNTHPQPTPGALLLTALCLLALLAPISASAAERVGRVLIASGDVTAQREGAPTRDLGGQDPIYAQDTIETGTDGRIQIQFTDGGMVDLQPDTRFRIAEYELDDGGGGSAVMEFLRGALRTVTGSIGDDEDDEYRMDTPVATIGIRGTAYALHYCNAACAEAGGQLGLYGRVDDGEISVGSGSDAITIGSGQFFFVPEGGAPGQIVAPPDGILDGNGDNGDGDEGTAPAPGNTRPPDDEPGVGFKDDTNDPLEPTFESSETIELGPRPGTTGEVFFAGAFFDDGASGSTFLLSPDDGDVRLRDDGATDSPVVGADFPNGVFANTSEATLADQGMTTIDSFDIHWGRWDGAVQADGVGDSSGSFVYAYTDPSNLTPASVVNNKDNSITYGLFDGPHAIARDGSLWNPIAWDMFLNFDDKDGVLNSFALDRISAPSTLYLYGNPNVTITNSATITVDPHTFDGGDWAGEIEGRFVGDNGQGLVIRYELDETGGNNAIKGVLIVEEGGGT